MERCCEGPAAIGAVDAPELEAELAKLAKALAHPARVRILRFLRAQRACVAGDIAEHLPLAPSTVSQHLKQLKEAGLVSGEIDGPRRCYCVDPVALDRLRALVSDL